jgi:hypothetical protein
VSVEEKAGIVEFNGVFVDVVALERKAQAHADQRYFAGEQHDKCAREYYHTELAKMVTNPRSPTLERIANTLDEIRDLLKRSTIFHN